MSPSGAYPPKKRGSIFSNSFEDSEEDFTEEDYDESDELDDDGDDDDDYDDDDESEEFITNFRHRGKPYFSQEL